MATSKEIRETPFATTHPAEIIKDELKARGMSQKELASRMEMQTSNLSRLLKGESITPSIAAKLEIAFDIPSSFWLNLQAQYEIDSKNIAIRNENELATANVEKMLTNIVNLPELYKRLSISSSCFIQEKLEKLELLLNFPVLDISKKPFALQPCFKKNEKYNLDERNQITWLTLAYIFSRKAKPVIPFTKGNALIAAKAIAEKVHQGNITENFISDILKNNGISYCVVPKLEKTPIDAVAINIDTYPSIVTTHRYNDMSRLVFNVLHELGHIELHMGTKMDSVFISSEYTYSNINKQEKEANEFAEDILIPKQIWSKMMSAGANNLSNSYIVKTLKKLSKEYSLNFNIVTWRYKYETNLYNLYGIKSQPIV